MRILRLCGYNVENLQISTGTNGAMTTNLFPIVALLRQDFMQNKTILHLTGMESTKYGGLERYLLELTRFCNQKGYHTVLQYESLPQSPAYLRDLEDLEAGVVIMTTNLNRLKSVRRIAALIRSIRPEIVQTHFGEPVFLGAPIARVLGVWKIITLAHSMPDLKKTSPRRFAYSWYDHVLCVSNAVANDLLNAGVSPKIVSTHYLGLFGHREKSRQLRLQFRNEFDIPLSKHSRFRPQSPPGSV